MAACDREDPVECEEDEEEEEEDEGPPLHELALQGVLDDNLHGLAVLSGSGLDVAAWTDALQMNLLHWAACNGSAKAARFLLSKAPALVADKNSWGEQPVDIAKRKGHDEVAALLSQA
eukprot:TRINITY_DN990_c1_g1_i1.p1 TRINITY_DN990_c1_g1~~TRINITY_DN990_c1_g1_i1.p1  ORF type:complete len:133 (+),score=45.20 TRINITY_DN990_c1_g1_i1:47-400(+)